MSDDRDTLVRKTPPAGVRAQTASPEVEIFEDVTGMHARGEIDDDEAERRRARRPSDPLSRLRHEHNALAETVTGIRVTVGEIRGQLNGQDAVLAEIRGTVREALARDGRAFEAHLDIRTAASKAEIADKADAKRARRKLIGKAIGAAIGLVTSGAVIHWLLGML